VFGIRFGLLRAVNVRLWLGFAVIFGVRVVVIKIKAGR